MFGEFAKPNPCVKETPPWIKEYVFQSCLRMTVKKAWRPRTGAFAFASAIERAEAASDEFARLSGAAARLAVDIDTIHNKNCLDGDT
jgi:hypothetical protein